MNREVLAYKRILTKTRIENALNSVKGEARSCASLVRALWDTRRSRTALPGQGTTEYAILVGVLVVIAIIAITVFRPKIQELWGCDLFWDQRALDLSGLGAGSA